jgi:hypothetical protein
MSGNSSLRIAAVALGLGMGSIMVQPFMARAFAQGVQPGYPIQQQAAPRQPGMRDVFAATLAAVVQSTGVAAASAISGGMNGAISGWLDRKNQRKGMMSYQGVQPGYGSQPGYGTQPGYAPYPGEQPGAPGPLPQGYPGVPGGTSNGEPTTGYPGTDGSSTGYPGTNPTENGYPNTGLPNAGMPNTGYPGADGGNGNYPGVPGGGSSGMPGMPGGDSLYAGFAYEIHAIGAGGYAQPVDPATHAFRTGDRFKVVYRPSMPGQVDVYNTNAAGQTSRIDTLNVAAGQLAELGPYEFTAMTGNETLILSLAPCSSAALMTATRNIVKVPDAMSGGNGSFQLSQCGSPATRGLRTKTRDIRKVSMEGGTNFGLDQLTPGEVTSGDVAPRQITISLQHQ